jgi:hypothetical protein
MTWDYKHNALRKTVYEFFYINDLVDVKVYCTIAELFFNFYILYYRHALRTKYKPVLSFDLLRKFSD